MKTEERVKVDVVIDVERLARIGWKVYLMLAKKAKNQFEAYATVLILKRFLESECGLIEAEFEPIVSEYEKCTR